MKHLRNIFVTFCAASVLFSCTKPLDLTTYKDRSFEVSDERTKENIISFTSRSSAALGGGLIAASIDAKGLKRIEENYTWKEDFKNTNQEFYSSTQKLFAETFPAKNQSPLVAKPSIVAHIIPSPGAKYVIQLSFLIKMYDGDKEIGWISCFQNSTSTRSLENVITNKERFIKLSKTALPTCMQSMKEKILESLQPKEK